LAAFDVDEVDLQIRGGGARSKGTATVAVPLLGFEWFIFTAEFARLSCEFSTAGSGLPMPTTQQKPSGSRGSEHATPHGRLATFVFGSA
jgi:hypothetical protein